MKKENFAEGYDIFTGKPTSPSTHYGEMHTGLAFEQARKSIVVMIQMHLPSLLSYFMISHMLICPEQTLHHHYLPGLDGLIRNTEAQWTLQQFLATFPISALNAPNLPRRSQHPSYRMSIIA
jgi:hypothetical protein